MRTPAEALSYAKQRASSLARYPEGHCLGFVDDCYDPTTRSVSATAAFSKAHLDTTTPNTQGLPVWWSGGTNGYGHVAIANGDGRIWSTDWADDGYKGDGRVRLIKLGSVSAFDNPSKPLIYRGWSLDLEGEEIPMPFSDSDKKFLNDLAKTVARETVKALALGADAANWFSDAEDAQLAAYSIKAVLGKLGSGAGGTITKADVDAVIAARFGKAAG